jgi:hypothetical protein
MASSCAMLHLKILVASSDGWDRHCCGCDNEKRNEMLHIDNE